MNTVDTSTATTVILNGCKLPFVFMMHFLGCSKHHSCWQNQKYHLCWQITAITVCVAELCGQHQYGNSLCLIVELCYMVKLIRTNMIAG